MLNAPTAASLLYPASYIFQPASINVVLRNIIMMAPAALLPTANGRLILSFVHSQWGVESLGQRLAEWTGQLTWPANRQPGNCPGWWRWWWLLPEIRRVFLHFVCCQPCDIFLLFQFFFHFFLLVYFELFCFRCISYAFRLLAFPLQVASQWRKKAAPCWHFTIHAKRNWQRVTHYPVCPQCCILLESNNLQRKSPLNCIIQILYIHIYLYIRTYKCMCVCAEIYIKSAIQPKALLQWLPHNGSEYRMPSQMKIDI